MQMYWNCFLKGNHNFWRNFERPIYCISYLLRWDTKASLVFGLMWSLCWWIPLSLTDFKAFFLSGVAGFVLCFGSPQANVSPDYWIFQNYLSPLCQKNCKSVTFEFLFFTWFEVPIALECTGYVECWLSLVTLEPLNLCYICEYYFYNNKTENYIVYLS